MSTFTNAMNAEGEAAVHHRLCYDIITAIELVCYFYKGNIQNIGA